MRLDVHLHEGDEWLRALPDYSGQAMLDAAGHSMQFGAGWAYLARVSGGMGWPGNFGREFRIMVITRFE